MAAILGDSAVVIVRTRPRAIPLAMITMRKSTHGFPFLSHDEYGTPLGGPLGYRSSTKIVNIRIKYNCVLLCCIFRCALSWSMLKEALSIAVSTSTCILVLKGLCHGVLNYF